MKGSKKDEWKKTFSCEEGMRSTNGFKLLKRTQNGDSYLIQRWLNDKNSFNVSLRIKKFILKGGNFNNSQLY